MNIETIKRFFNEIVFAAYLSRALPGAVLLTGIQLLIQLSVDNVFLSTLLALGTSWGLGLGLESLFFVKHRKLHIDQTSDVFRSRVPLFIALLGITLLIAPWGALADLAIDDQFLDVPVSEDTLLALALRCTIVAIIGLLFLVKGMQMMKRFRA
jgi:hypothetical protein